MQQWYGGVIRRQQHLIRCLVGDYHSSSSGDTLLFVNKSTRMQSVMSGGSPTLEADALGILRTISPTLDATKHKGQAGKIAVVGGCREYTGAPYFSAISALKIGADLSHVFCTRDAAPVIKSYSPELIVHPLLEESYNVRDEDRKSISTKVLAEVDKWMERFDCLVIGPGLGRDPFLLDCVSDIMKHARQSNVPMVIDGDGLFLVTNCLDLVSGYPLAVLTPNVNEYKRLVQKVLNCEVNDQDGPQQLLSLASSIGGVTILRKGKSDYISDGKEGYRRTGVICEITNMNRLNIWRLSTHNMAPSKMIFNFHVFGPSMENLILGYMDSIVVITVELHQHSHGVPNSCNKHCRCCSLSLRFYTRPSYNLLFLALP